MPLGSAKPCRFISVLICAIAASKARRDAASSHSSLCLHVSRTVRRPVDIRMLCADPSSRIAVAVPPNRAHHMTHHLYLPSGVAQQYVTVGRKLAIRSRSQHSSAAPCRSRTAAFGSQVQEVSEHPYWSGRRRISYTHRVLCRKTPASLGNSVRLYCRVVVSFNTSASGAPACWLRSA